MTDFNTSEDAIAELKTEIEALKSTIAEQQEKAEAKSIVYFNKVKNTLDDGAKSLLAAVKPVLERYEEPGRAAVEKVGTRVSDNPFLSVVVAFGAGIVIGKLLDLCCIHTEEE
ncbi:MAG: hypothetical protein GXZ00_05220 [Synergistaceae bacterium]|nr:hypothetical protein [Synergistaceae bacterium]